MVQTTRRIRQRLLVVTVTGLLVLGAVGAAAQTAVPSPATGESSIADELAAAQAQVRELSAQNDRLQQLLGAFETMYDPMEADRQLLVELRKPLPEDRPTAEAYLRRLQALAIRSDPSRLGQPASRMLETAPTFLDWRGGTFASEAERQVAFLTSGAAGFDTDFQELQNAILLTVANRLDALLTLRDRVR